MEELTPYLQDADFTLYVGDVRDMLRGLPSESVQMCVTSPPYWGLRDYGTGSWDGGNPDCEHRVGGQVQDSKAPGAITTGQRPGVDASLCLDCGAVRVDKQLGLELTPEEYIANMVEVFHEVKRVLRKDGTLWLNIGDSYASNWGMGAKGRNSSWMSGKSGELEGKGWGVETAIPPNSFSKTGPIKPKDLVGIPWMLAFALRADGWYLRSDVIWSKANPMPESIRDRPTKSHEYLFLLAKSQSYYYDADAIREPFDEKWKETWEKHPKNPLVSNPDSPYREARNTRGGGVGYPDAAGRNKRSVWEVTTEAYPDAHFATFPTKLIEPCILAGCPEGGVVLDPFMGSGTTAFVARKLGRKSIGIELNEKYALLSIKRLGQQSLFA